MAWDFENRISVSTTSGKPVALVYDGFAVWFFVQGGVSIFTFNNATMDLYHNVNHFFDDYANVPYSGAHTTLPDPITWSVGQTYFKNHIVRILVPGSDPEVYLSYRCTATHVSTNDTNPYDGVDKDNVWISPHTGIYVHACQWAGTVYALVDGASTYISVMKNGDSNTQQIECPVNMSPRIAAANGKLWMVSEAADANGQQTLHIYEIATDTWSSTLIPGRKQNVEPRDIIDGLDGSIYITDANSHGIHEYNHVTNAYVAFHRINRHPYKLAVNQAKTVYVTSDASGLYNGGMVNTFNQSTNTATAFCAAGGDHEVLCDDERAGYVWMFGRGAGMMRVSKATKDVKTLNTGVLIWSRVPQDDLPNSGSTVASDAFQPEWTEGQSFTSGTKCKSPVDGKVYVSSYSGVKTATQYDIPGVPDNAALSLWLSRQALYQDTFAGTTVDSYIDYPVTMGLVIPRRSYERWNGTGFDTVTIPEHIVVVRTQCVTTPDPAYYNILNIVRANALVRNNSTDVRGTALISVGPTDFIGDF